MVGIAGSWEAARFLMSWFWGENMMAAERAVRTKTKGMVERMVACEFMGSKFSIYH